MLNRYSTYTKSPFLTEIELQQIAPSVFAVDHSKELSTKYTQIPTIEAVRTLVDMGFGVVKAEQSTCRDEGKKAHVKHMLRLRQRGSVEVGGIHPEIVLINSHDGKSSYQLRAGLYRLVCSNGLVVGNDLFCHKVRHQGDIISEVIQHSQQIVNMFPEAIDTMHYWKSIQLDNHARLAFAEAASALRWNDEELPMPSSNLLTHKRRADEARDVWTTFNVLQENLVRGGQRYRTENNQRQSTRAVKSVSENNRLNVALWKLTEALVKQVA